MKSVRTRCSRVRAAIVGLIITSTAGRRGPRRRDLRAERDRRVVLGGILMSWAGGPDWCMIIGAFVIGISPTGGDDRASLFWQTVIKGLVMIRGRRGRPGAAGGNVRCAGRRVRR